MEPPQEVDDYIEESIAFALGLPVSPHTLELKVRAYEEANKRLRDQYFYLQIRLKEKDEIIERARAEASMNAQAVKKFVEENQKLAMECANLLSQCTRWEKECSLYDQDREVLMEFGNEADEHAKEAEIRVHELEEELRRMAEELQLCKYQLEIQSVDLSPEESAMDELLVDSLMTTLLGNDEVESTAHAFLEANSGSEVCQRFLKTWDSLRPPIRKVLALAAEMNNLQNDKEHLRINLTRAEEEVRVLFEENKLLDKENKRLMRHEKERRYSGSGGKHTSSASAKGNKRKSSPKMSGPTERTIHFIDVDSPRKPLSPLHQNSPDSVVHKK